MGAAGEVGPLRDLVLNAGALFLEPVAPRADGIEQTFATNCLGHCCLMSLILDDVSGASAVWTASDMRDTDTVDGRIGEIDVADGRGGRAHRSERPLKELALADREQHLGDARRRKDADVPSTAAGHVRKPLRPEPVQAHLDGHQAGDVREVRSGEAHDDRSAGVMPGDVRRSHVEMLDEVVQVLGRRGAAEFAGAVA